MYCIHGVKSIYLGALTGDMFVGNIIWKLIGKIFGIYIVVFKAHEPWRFLIDSYVNDEVVSFTTNHYKITVLKKNQKIVFMTSFVIYIIRMILNMYESNKPKISLK